MTPNALQLNAGINDCRDSESEKETREGSIDPSQQGHNQTECQEEATYRLRIFERKCITVQMASATARVNNGGLRLHLLYLLLTACQAPLNLQTIIMHGVIHIISYLPIYLLTYSLTVYVISAVYA